ncbi:MAG: trigger factor [Candidatus Magasanikbacteria bacterium]|nr:trigger factor [Candidatus Magasanikbacteria bacterium]
MQTKFSTLPKSQVEFTIELSVEELKPYLEKAATALSAAGKISGFRPGHAPYDIVAKSFGEMAIYEAAGDKIISRTLNQAVKEKDLAFVGEPKIEVVKLAPGNPFIFKAVISLMPKIKLGKWQEIKIKKQIKKIGAEEVDKVLEDARKMRATEVLVDRAASGSDKVMIDLDITQDKVPVEGGQAKDHAVFLDEKYYIPGLPEQLVGLKKDEVKEFSLSFPEGHYQKHLAGKKADFKATVKGVFERTMPVMDDVFAQGLGQKNMAELRALIENNLKVEAEQREDRRVEIEMIDGIVKKSEFGELPEVLILSEKQKMFEELRQNLAEMGMQLEDYLKKMKKTEEDLAKEFSKGAEERTKSALILREIAREEKIECSDTELVEETARVRETYKDNEHIDERLSDPGTQSYLANMLVNRKVLKMLKEKMITV